MDWKKLSGKRMRDQKEKRTNLRRSEEFRPLNEKGKCYEAGCADRLQNDKMLPYHAAKKKMARTKHVSNWSK